MKFYDLVISPQPMVFYPIIKKICEAANLSLGLKLDIRCVWLDDWIFYGVDIGLKWMLRIIPTINPLNVPRTLALSQFSRNFSIYDIGIIILTSFIPYEETFANIQ